MAHGSGKLAIKLYTFETKTSTMFHSFFLDEAELIGTIFYGAGSTKIEADRYRFYNEKDNVVFYFNFMPETCVPIDRVEYQSTNEGMVSY